MMKDSYKDILTFISSLFFPNRCIFCGEPIAPFDFECDLCVNSVPLITGEICPCCGAGLVVCECKKKPAHYYDRIVAPLYYDGLVKDCIHRFKFKGERSIYSGLARLMADTLFERYCDIDFDCITYVPMFRRKEKERGFNQSRLLAKEISRLSGIEFADGMLLKLYNTDNQHDCTGLERTGNLLGAFDMNDKFDVSDKTVLLIDDVKTSGATLNECGKILYLNDAKSVICLTAALRNSKIG